MTNPFQGHFDGRGHTVTYTVKAGEKEHGLFPYLAGTEDVTADVRDLMVVVEEYSPKKDAAGGALVCRAEKSIISGVSVTLNKYTAPADGDSAGGSGLVGTVEADALIENCNVKAAAGAYSKFGGIAYENKGTVQTCEFVLNEGESTLAGYGGIVSNNSGAVSDCRATLPESTVTVAETEVGGITAVCTAGTISGCASAFSVTGTPKSIVSRIGGVCGSVNGGVVENCTASGSVVFGSRYMGGIAGMISSSAPVIIRDCTSNIGSLGSQANPMELYGGGVFGGAEMSKDTRIENCISSTDVYGRADIGGICGYGRFRAGTEMIVFTITDCHSYAQTILGSAENVGGGIGLIGFTMDGSGNFVEGTPTATIVRNCTVSAEVRGNTYVGGFLGFYENAEADARQSAIESCSATGAVTAVQDKAGGFVGGNAIRSKNVTYQNCNAGGDVAGRNFIGGFIGVGEGSGNRFLVCTARGSVSGNDAAGGFVGYSRGVGDVYGENNRSCYAYGAVRGAVHAGGFLGLSSVAAPQYVSITDCHAYGDLSIYGLGISGAFIGEQNGVVIKDCTASGNISWAEDGAASTWGYGGFVGNSSDIDCNNSIINCKAYGNADGGPYGIRVGGFAGEWGDTGGNAIISGSESYGTVKGADVVGGFVGNLTSSSAIIGNASYCPELTCPGVNKGAFAGNIPNLDSHKFSNNKYTELPDCTPNGGAAEMPPAGGTVLPPEEIKVSPKSILDVALTPENGRTKIAFTFTNAAEYALVSFEISTDAGKTYTALVWDKVALVDLAPGALNCANFAYTYAAPCTTNTKVRVKISNGTDTVTTEFTYQ